MIKGAFWGMIESQMSNNSYPIKMRAEGLDFYYGSFQALKKIDLEIKEQQITSLIGPSGCGKSTFLRTLNRMNDLIPHSRVTGTVLLDGENIYAPEINPVNLRQRVGMVFQRPNPFPKSIFENVAFGPKVLGTHRPSQLGETVEKSLKGAALWEEVADHLQEDATGLSLGQQQRLCIARALTLDPEILLLDEPTSFLDARSGQIIEDLLLSLKESCTILLISHYMDQIRRIADRVMELPASDP